MRLYKIVGKDWKTMMTRSDTYPFVKDHLFIKWFFYEDDASTERTNKKKYKIVWGWFMNTHVIQEIIPLEYIWAEEEFMDNMDDNQKIEWLKLGKEESIMFNKLDPEEKEFLKNYYKEDEDEIDDGVDYADTI